MTSAFRGRAGLRLLTLVFSFSLLGAGVRPPGLGDVTEIRTYEHADKTRVVIELSREATFSTGYVDNPPRYYIDIKDTWIEEPVRVSRKLSETHLVRAVHGGQNTLRTARVVVQIDRTSRPLDTFTVRSPDPFRIVTDIHHGSRSAPRVVVQNEDAFDRRPVRRVVIDPGHGGKDPGASGGGLREKDVVLAVSKALKKRLQREGLEVHLTRDRDVFVPLEQRTRLANGWHGDLFVSVHANAAPRRASHGIETYLLDTRYDRHTARVAARENGTTIDELNDLQRILASLRLSYSERYAAPLAEAVHEGLLTSVRGRYGKTRDLGVKRGPFMVLFQADMPAILVEVGFVTNRDEAKRLKNRHFAKTAANGIAEGILRYRSEHARSIVAGR